MSTISRRSFLVGAAGFSPAMALAGCGGSGGALASDVTATPFPEAESLFHSDPRWLGGDGVYSIDLGSNRVLWLFGDSFVDLSSKPSRTTAKMPRNTVAIQTGYAATASTMRFFWNQSNGVASSFFANPNPDRWYWPGHGARIGNRLVVFLVEQKAVSGGLGFQGTGWTAVAIDNPDSPCDQWKPKFLTVSNPFSLSFGAAVSTDADYMYAFATPMTTSSSVYLARWPLTAVQAGDLSSPDWLVAEGKWTPQSQLKSAPPTIFGNGQTEFNVYPNPPHAADLLVQTVGFGSCPLAYRIANGISGPWPAPVSFYNPPEMGLTNVIIYSAKLHPTLVTSGADFVASYSTNNLDFNSLVHDTSLYYPRMLKCAWKVK